MIKKIKSICKLIKFVLIIIRITGFLHVTCCLFRKMDYEKNDLNYIN
jgi:hypothetical protein